MRKLYVICTGAIMLTILIHIVYMVMGITGAFEVNVIFAVVMGYALMTFAVLHGIYGLSKWIKVLVHKKRLAKKTELSNCITAAKKITIVQRISGVMVVALVVPHTLIILAEADSLLLIVDILFVLFAVVHLFIGIPKWLVSAGLLGKKAEEKFSAFYGGKENV